MTIRDISYTGEGQIPIPLIGEAFRHMPLYTDAITDVAVHHMTGWGPPSNASAELEVRFLQGIDEYHRSGRGLDGIGYHIVPMASGRVYIVSRLDRYGAGVGGHNNHTLHVALPGTFDTNLPSPQHMAATVEAVRHIYNYLGRDVPTTPHLAWGGTTCPGARWREWVPQLRALAKGDVDMPLTPEDKEWFITLRNDAVAMVNTHLDKHFEYIEKEWLMVLRGGALDHIDHMANARTGDVLAGIKGISNEVVERLKA